MDYFESAAAKLANLTGPCSPFFNRELNMKHKKQCGAHARSTGAPCRAKALPNGRCKLHGGLSTGPRSAEGRQAIGAATKARMAAGQLQKAMAGRVRWLDAGGREMLSRKAKQRHARARWLKMMTNSAHA